LNPKNNNNLICFLNLKKIDEKLLKMLLYLCMTPLLKTI
jgi:hypothetical protein